MKALVTGGAGFIGSHLAQALVEMGIAVTVLDNLRNGDYGNLDWASSNKGFQFVKGDVRKRATVAKVIAGCDWVFHEAALSSVPQSILNPSRTNQHNLDATLVLLAAAQKAGVKRFIYASSSAIYGDSSTGVISETSPPNPLSPYALQKYSSECYCKLFYKLYGVPTVSLRYFNVFGPRQRWDSSYSGVIARFCTAFILGQSPTIFGDGRQTRDFVYVDDVVRANLLAAQASPEQVTGRSFNIIQSADYLADGIGGFLMHLARAVDCRSVIIYASRETPEQSG